MNRTQRTFVFSGVIAIALLAGCGEEKKPATPATGRRGAGKVC